MALLHKSGQPLLKRFSRSFLERADEAAFWEAYVGAELARKGLHVLHLPMKFGEFHDPACSTDCDLEVFKSYEASMNQSPGVGVEVKSRNIYFTSPEDYHWDSVRVCSESWFRKNWGNYDKFARDFLLVSQKTGAIVWVPAGTAALMGNRITDRERNETFNVVECAKADLRPLDEFVKSILRPSN